MFMKLTVLLAVVVMVQAESVPVPDLIFRDGIFYYYHIPFIKLRNLFLKHASILLPLRIHDLPARVISQFKLFTAQIEQGG